MQKRALVASLAVVGLTLTSFQGVDASIVNKASQTTVSQIDSKAVGESKGGRFEPMKTRKPIDGQKIANNTQDDFEFDIPAGFCWVKVYVFNTGDADINVSVTNAKGKEVMSGKVRYGRAFDIKSSSPWSTGLHTVSVTSAEDMSGKVSVKIAENKSELDN
ncbi:hypothetical protein P4V47_08525 [Brevibacillus laterosporus]|uniref:hypothetical protein n=1 Tax=Brevibacillus laterosporus TaxID=1465 RepID=UPI002E1E3F72|nr:hypothetical protein [Brevibacillus laterosporus]